MSTRPECEQWHRQAQHALVRRDYRRTHELCLQILSVAPDFADAYYLLACIAADHENFRKAFEVAGRAVALQPQCARYHAFRARCCIALNDSRQAGEIALHALSLPETDPATLDTIGVALTRAGRYADALDPLRRAVTAEPDVAAYQYNYATVLQFNGDLAGAGAAYGRALELDPEHSAAWLGLSGLTASLEPDQVAAIEARLQRPLDEDGELHLCHALARHYENLGNPTKAFSWLQRGKQRKRACLGYDSGKDEALFKAVREVCTEHWLSTRTPACDSSEPIFIVGMPRTGTTLVERILSSHPDVYSAGELTQFALTIKRATGTPSNLIMDPQTLRAAVDLDYSDLGQQYIESTRPRTGHVPRFIDKMPLNFFYAGFIHRALPNARILCIRRNPLDTCLSSYRQLFATRFPYYNYSFDLLDAGRYYLQFDALMKFWRAAMPARFMEVQYESVVEDIESEARRLLAFCGLRWDPACLDFHRNDAPVATASSVQVRQPLYRTSVERWRKYEFALQPLQQLLRSAGAID